MIRTVSPALRIALSLYIATALAGCATGTSARLAPTQKATGQIANPASENCARQGGTLAIEKHGDGGEYCAAVGTIDTPDGRYDGANMPESLIQGMIQQRIVSPDAPPEFQRNAVWRCMDKSVWVCHFGANHPCQEKADTSQVPTSEVEEYCRVNPTADNIPAVVTGRATVYQWRCKNGVAKVVRQLFRKDPQGYLADFWHELKK
jgi:putative hemolysin